MKYYLNGHEVTSYIVLLMIDTLLIGESTEVKRFVLKQLKKYGIVIVNQHTIEKK